MAATGLCCAIELEPRTLNRGQISDAREAAADIVQNIEAKEASEMFAQRPLGSIKRGVEREGDDEIEGVININGRHGCQCIDMGADVSESPELAEVIREPISAPF